MAKTTRICKVCGKEYEYCKTWLNTDKFRYQDVACSPECGAEYFKQIAISRGELKPEEPEEVKLDMPKPTPKKAASKKKAEPKSDEK